MSKVLNSKSILLEDVTVGDLKHVFDAIGAEDDMLVTVRGDDGFVLNLDPENVVIDFGLDDEYEDEEERFDEHEEIAQILDEILGD